MSFSYVSKYLLIALTLRLNSNSCGRGGLVSAPTGWPHTFSRGIGSMVEPELENGESHVGCFGFSHHCFSNEFLEPIKCYIYEVNLRSMDVHH